VPGRVSLLKVLTQKLRSWTCQHRRMCDDPFLKVLSWGSVCFLVWSYLICRETGPFWIVSVFTFYFVSRFVQHGWLALLNNQ
jgi:hypothetical protein